MGGTALVVAELALTAASAAYAVHANQQQKKATKAIQQQQQLEADQTAEVKMAERRKRADAERAQIRTSAADSGVGGGAVGAMLDDVLFQEGQDVSLIDKQRNWQNDETNLQAWSNNQRSTARMVGSVLGSGMQAAGYYNKYRIATQSDGS